MAIYNTKQAVFNKVWRAFVVEKAPKSIADHGFCRYRGPNGTACAIGVCIPDRMYNKAWESSGGITSIASTHHAEFEAIFNGVSINFLWAMQLSHDRDFEVMETELRYVATEHDLTIPGTWRHRWAAIKRLFTKEII